MAKEVTFIMDAPPSDALARRWWQFLIEATARREKVTVTGTVRLRAAQAEDEAS